MGVSNQGLGLIGPLLSILQPQTKPRPDQAGTGTSGGEAVAPDPTSPRALRTQQRNNSVLGNPLGVPGAATTQSPTLRSVLG